MKSPIIILPGWKLSGSTYKNLVWLLDKNGYKTYVLDLPGFGKEELISDSMTLSDYTDFVEKFITIHKIQSVILIGHSFGGRLAIKYSYLYPKKVELLILTGVPVIRNISFKKRIATIIAHTGKSLQKVIPKNIFQFFRKLIYYSVGEWDYYKSGNLKKVFLNVVNESLVEYIKQLSMPILLIWGENDTFTPVSDVEEIKKLNIHIKSVIVKNTNHRLPCDYPEKFFNSIKVFL